MRDEVLLVEDDAETARRLGRALEEAGFAVHRVASGEEGLGFLAARPVACAVIDARQPIADGVEILRRLRDRGVVTPVVMLSTTGSVDLAVRALQLGAKDFVDARGDYLPALVAKIRGAVADAGVRRRRGRLVRPVFVGRETELRFLRGELARTAAGGGGVVLLTGDNGIGKTSLAFELARLAPSDGALVLWGHCDESRGAPAYWPWTEILRSYAAMIDGSALRGDLAGSAGAVARLVPALRALCPEPSGADAAERTQFHLFDGVTQFLRRAAARRPLVLVLDDLHQADADSVRLLRALTTEIASTRVLVVATCREYGVDGTTRAEIGRIADHPLTSVLRLTGFDETDVWRYIAEATDVHPAHGLVRAIVRRTEGNPLFVADVVSLLAADGRLGDDPGDAEPRIAIPENRRQAIADRLARLSPDCQRLLGAAAVVGPEVDVEVLAGLVDRDPMAVRAAIDEAIAHRLVVARDPHEPIRFSNVLVQDVLRDRLPPGERPRLHARVADLLEASSTGPDRPLAAIAHHRLEGATSPAGVARAFDSVVAAADHAAELMAHEEAARYYEVALRVGERGGLATPGVRTGLLVKLAEARWRAGDTAAARDAGGRALSAARETGDPAAVAFAALAFAGRLPGFGAIACDEQVVAELERALAELSPTSTALRALVMARLAEELTYLPRRTADRTLAPKAITLARSLDDPAVLASALRTTQWSVWTPDDVERRRQLAEEIIELAARTRDPVLALDGELLRLWSALEHAEMDVARRQLALATRLAERLRLPYYAWITTAARACLHIATGRLDDAERVADEALRAGDPVTNPTVPLFVGAQRGHIMWHRGRFEELARWLTDVLGDFPMLASAVECSLVITYAEAGQRELAQAALARYADDDFAGVPRNAMWLMNMTSLAEGCAQLGDVPAARRLYPQLAPFARYNVVLVPAWVGAPVAHYMAGLALLLGDRAAAQRHFEDALALEARTGTRQWGARTQLAYARLLRGSGRIEDAERADQLVASARAIADELGLAPVRRLADAATVGAESARIRSCVFRRRGDTWDVAFEGRRATLRHRRGMDYLRILLERPGVAVASLELASVGGRGLLADAGERAVDRRAIAEVQRRIAELETEIDGCARRNAAPSDALRVELAQCEAYLASCGGGLLSASDRARTAVTKAIARAIEAIGEVHGALGQHLTRHVETGRACVYVPDLVAPVRFEL